MEYLIINRLSKIEQDQIKAIFPDFEYKLIPIKHVSSHMDLKVIITAPDAMKRLLDCRNLMSFLKEKQYI